MNDNVNNIPLTGNNTVSNNNQSNEKTKRNNKFVLVLLIIIIILIGYIFYSMKANSSRIEQLKYNCTPVNSYKEKHELDINSTLVQDLYRKVHTNIREDLAQPDWDNTMKLYLAYRQIGDSYKYDTNCNMFNASSMEPYSCEVSVNFTPKGFKVDTLIIEWKKLFGEDTEISFDNIKLKNSCIGGFEYIPEREEFVQGFCGEENATSFKADKKLTKAVTYNDTIILTENVKYRGNEKMDLPDYLKSGDYLYTFRLDMNYNYVLVSKIYDDKYN